MRHTIIALAAAASLLLLPGVSNAQELIQSDPKIRIDAVNEKSWPFDYACTNAVKSPVTVTGGGAVPAPTGPVDQYSVAVNWGDGGAEPVPASFVPPSGKGAMTLTYTAGPHDYATGGSKTIRLTLYRSSTAVGSSIATVCVSPPDEDKDGIDDRWETAYGLDPADPADAALDADNDGVYNLDEYEHHADPRNPDSDDDGMPDKWEFDHGLVLDTNDATEDADEDGRDNLTEYQEGTDPQVADRIAGWGNKGMVLLTSLLLIGVLIALIFRNRKEAGR